MEVSDDPLRCSVHVGYRKNLFLKPVALACYLMWERIRPGLVKICVKIISYHRKYILLMNFFFCLRANGWESSEGIGSPAYQCALFATRLTLGLLNTYVLNLSLFVTLLTIWFPWDHNQVLLRGAGASASVAFQFCWHCSLSQFVLHQYHPCENVTWHPIIVFSRQFRWSPYREQDMSRLPFITTIWAYL